MSDFAMDGRQSFEDKENRSFPFGTVFVFLIVLVALGLAVLGIPFVGNQSTAFEEEMLDSRAAYEAARILYIDAGDEDVENNSLGRGNGALEEVADQIDGIAAAADYWVQSAKKAMSEEDPELLAQAQRSLANLQTEVAGLVEEIPELADVDNQLVRRINDERMLAEAAANYVKKAALYARRLSE